MKISGGTTFGNCAIGSPTNVTKPTITMMMDITMATILRLMKNLDMTAISECGPLEPFAPPQNWSLLRSLLLGFFACLRRRRVRQREGLPRLPRDCQYAHRPALAGYGFCCPARRPRPDNCLAIPKRRAGEPAACRV